MKRVLDILVYASEVIGAIVAGAKVANDKWPATNPFASSKPSTGGKPVEQPKAQ